MDIRQGLQCYQNDPGEVSVVKVEVDPPLTYDDELLLEYRDDIQTAVLASPTPVQGEQCSEPSEPGACAASPVQPYEEPYEGECSSSPPKVTRTDCIRTLSASPRVYAKLNELQVIFKRREGRLEEAHGGDSDRQVCIREQPHPL